MKVLELLKFSKELGGKFGGQFVSLCVTSIPLILCAWVGDFVNLFPCTLYALLQEVPHSLLLLQSACLSLPSYVTLFVPSNTVTHLVCECIRWSGSPLRIGWVPKARSPKSKPVRKGTGVCRLRNLSYLCVFFELKSKGQIPVGRFEQLFEKGWWEDLMESLSNLTRMGKLIWLKCKFWNL